MGEADMSQYAIVFFDFGGVLAEEGFREGLKAIGRDCGRNPEDIYQCGKELVYSSGYVVGKTSEACFWEKFRQKTSINRTDQQLRHEILSRFLLRPGMLSAVQTLARRGYRLAILSDQTNWLDELNQQHGFFPLFEQVFNSYHQGRSKKDPEFFSEVLEVFSARPHESLFLDDDQGNLDRAAQKGIAGLLVEQHDNVLRSLSKALDEDF